jgi:hypothetical protein
MKTEPKNTDPAAPAEIVNDTSDRIDSLVLAALRDIQEADALPLPQLPVQEFINWVKKVAPNCNKLSVVSSALEVKIQIAEGEVIRAGGELRGGDHSKQSDTVSHFAEAERKQRSRKKALADNAENANEYLAENLRTGRNSSVRAALRAGKVRSSGASLKQADSDAAAAAQPEQEDQALQMPGVSEEAKAINLKLAEHKDIVRKYMRAVGHPTVEGALAAIDTAIAAVAEPDVTPQADSDAAAAELEKLKAAPANDAQEHRKRFGMSWVNMLGKRHKAEHPQCYSGWQPGQHLFEARSPDKFHEVVIERATKEKYYFKYITAPSWKSDTKGTQDEPRFYFDSSWAETKLAAVEQQIHYHQTQLEQYQAMMKALQPDYDAAAAAKRRNLPQVRAEIEFVRNLQAKLKDVLKGYHDSVDPEAWVYKYAAKLKMLKVLDWIDEEVAKLPAVSQLEAELDRLPEEYTNDQQGGQEE